MIASNATKVINATLASICPPPHVGHMAPSVGDGYMSPVVFARESFYMTECDFHRAAQHMEQYGGGFLSRLASLYYVADSSNQRKLRTAFIDEFVRCHEQRVAKLRRS